MCIQQLLLGREISLSQGVLHGQETVSLQAMWWQSASRAFAGQKNWSHILLKKMLESISEASIQTCYN
jgi:hypothetical protein